MASIVAAAFVLRLWGLSKSHFWDETAYLQNAEVICCGKANFSELDFRAPLLSLIFAGAFLLWRHVYAACIAAAALNAAGPALLYWTGRMITGRIPAAIAAMLLAFAPFFVAFGHNLLTDSPEVTVILLAFWLLLHALRRQDSLEFAGAGFALALALLMRFLGAPAAGALALLLLAADRPRRAVLACCAGFAAGFGPYLCWSRIRYGGFLSTLLPNLDFVPVTQGPPTYYLRHFGEIFSWITLAGLLLWIVRRAWEKRPFSRPEAFLWIWAGIVFAFFSALPHKETRYIMAAAPPLFLLAGMGLGWVFEIRHTGARIAGTILLVAALGYTFLPSFRRLETPFVDGEVSEEMQVSDFLNRNVPPTSVLYTNFQYPLYGWYTNLDTHGLEYTGPALYHVLNHLPGDGIFIAYKSRDVVAGPDLAWLDANPHYRRFREFPSIVLYEYRASVGR